MRIYEKELEQSRAIKRNDKRREHTTDDGRWHISVSIRHKDGAYYRWGFVMRKRGDEWKEHAAWNYGDHEDAIVYQGKKLPDYVKAICEDLGHELKMRNPLLGIDFVDPDYVLKEEV